MNRLLPLVLALACALENLAPLARAQGQAEVRADRVLVRSRPSQRGEVVARLERGQRVLVFEEGLPALLATDTVTEWTRIELPAGTRAWVSADYVDTAGRVTARLLNVRAGPSEDYAVLGTVALGASLQIVGQTNGWLQILAPPGLSGFVAAHLLRPVESPPAAPAAPSTRAVLPSPPAPSPNETNREAPAPAPAPPAETVPEPAPAAPDPPAPRAEISGAPADLEDFPDAHAAAARVRIVPREGIVRGTLSIQAPAAFELRGTDSGRRLNYLYPASPGLDLRRLRGARVRVTGEEYLDPRWPVTPVLLVEDLVLAP